MYSLKQSQDMVMRYEKKLDEKDEEIYRLQEEIESLEVRHSYSCKIARERAERIKELEDGLQKFLDGDYPHPRTYRPKQCPHDLYYWEDCYACDYEYIEKLLNRGRDELE